MKFVQGSGFESKNKKFATPKVIKQARYLGRFFFLLFYWYPAAGIDMTLPSPSALPTQR